MHMPLPPLYKTKHYTDNCFTSLLTQSSMQKPLRQDSQPFLHTDSRSTNCCRIHHLPPLHSCLLVALPPATAHLPRRFATNNGSPRGLLQGHTHTRLACPSCRSCCC
jgi:hypothetical protein